MDHAVREVETVSPYMAKIIEGFQSYSGIYTSRLIPARFEHVVHQLAAVSPWVDRILVYQYQGMMNQPGSAAFCGSPRVSQTQHGLRKLAPHAGARQREELRSRGPVRSCRILIL
jgi:hypothetical protein